MADHGYIVIRNFDRYQHPDTLRSQRISWIRDYVDELDDEDYVGLTLHQRGTLHGLRRLYARTHGRLVADPRRLTHMLGERVTTATLEALVHAGKLTIVASKPASKVASKVASIEENRREDKREDHTPPLINGVVSGSTNAAAEAKGARDSVSAAAVKNDNKPKPPPTRSDNNADNDVDAEVELERYAIDHDWSIAQTDTARAEPSRAVACFVKAELDGASNIGGYAWRLYNDGVNPDIGKAANHRAVRAWIAEHGYPTGSRWSRHPHGATGIYVQDTLGTERPTYAVPWGKPTIDEIAAALHERGLA